MRDQQSGPQINEKTTDMLKLVQQLSIKMCREQELCKEVLRELGLFSLKTKKAKAMVNCSLQLTYTENKGNSSQKYSTKRQEAMAAS